MPKIIMHNQMSLDGAISGFQINPAIYYGIVNSLGAQMYLIGSDTAISGIHMFVTNTHEEQAADFHKPEPIEDDKRPYWVIPDSTGKLENWLHIFRNYEHCRDVIVLISENAPTNYIEYLKQRNYTYFVAGKVKVDFPQVFKQLHQSIPYTTMLTDSGGVLSNVLLQKSLIDQISLIVSPILTDKKNPKLFRELTLGKRVISLNPKEVEILEDKEIRMLLDVVK